MVANHRLPTRNDRMGRSYALSYSAS